MPASKNKAPTSQHSRAQNGMGSVRPYRGKWRVKVTVSLIDGKQHQLSRLVSTRKEAELLRAHFLSDASRGLLRASSTLLIRTLLRQWLDGKRAVIGPITYENYNYLCARYIYPTLGHILVQKLKASDVRRFYATLAAAYSASLLRQVRTILVQAFDEAVLDDLLPRNPAKGLRLPKSQEMGNGSRALAPEEVRLLLNAAALHPLGLVIELLILTGLRRSEVCGLTWEHLDLEKGLLCVRERVAMVGGQPMIGTLKTEASYRTIPLASSTVELLRKWRAEQESRHSALVNHTLSRQAVFTNLQGRPLHPDALSRLVSDMGRDARLGRVRCHDLRHTFTSLQLARGVPAPVVQVWLGHSSVNVTLNVYRHVLPHEHDRYVAGLEQLLDVGPANVPFALNAEQQQPQKVL